MGSTEDRDHPLVWKKAIDLWLDSVHRTGFLVSFFQEDKLPFLLLNLNTSLQYCTWQKKKLHGRLQKILYIWSPKSVCRYNIYAKRALYKNLFPGPQTVRGRIVKDGLETASANYLLVRRAEKMAAEIFLESGQFLKWDFQTQHEILMNPNLYIVEDTLYYTDPAWSLVGPNRQRGWRGEQGRRWWEGRGRWWTWRCSPGCSAPSPLRAPSSGPWQGPRRLYFSRCKEYLYGF